MNKLIGLLLLLPLMGSEPAGYKYWSAATLQAFGNSSTTSFPDLAKFGPDRAVMAHRTRSGSAELHENESDLMVVVSGAGTLLVGGSMQGAKATARGELRGPSIRGGSRQKLSPGDIVHVPPKIPHQVLLEPGTQITYFVLKVKE
jgi:mannose-6-phosphate isomerase-like protein (cupin superfamily)